MKKIFLFITALVALAMSASCQKEQVNENPTTGVTRFTASIEQTKTAINGVKINWVEGDEITVTDASKATAVYVAESSGASTTFNIKSETPLGSVPYTATYGALDSQIYDAAGANCPLTAESETTDFTFSCPWSVLKITAKSAVDKSIGKVTILNGSTSLCSLDCGNVVRSWLMTSLSVNNLINESSTLRDRIILEDIPSGGGKN